MKEKELIEVKSSVLQFEEQALKHQQELLNYKRDTEAKILLLQSRYNEELNRINQEKRSAVQELTKKLQNAQEKRDQLFKVESKSFKLGTETPQEISRSFTILRQDTGSTGSNKIISHRRQHSDTTLPRRSSLQNLKQVLSNQSKVQKIYNNPQTIKISKKSHRKSTQSLNISKLSDRNLSKCKFKRKFFLITNFPNLARQSLKQKIAKGTVVMQSLKKSPTVSKLKQNESVSNMELVPLKSARTIYYPQNFKKFKSKRKIKFVKKTPRDISAPKSPQML